MMSTRDIIARQRVLRARQLIDRQNRGVDAWKLDEEIALYPQGSSAYMVIRSTSHQSRRGLGRRVEIYSGDGEGRIANLSYGPPRRLLGIKRPRQLLRTDYM